MTETKSGFATYFRLQIAYFLQFAIWGSYGFALCQYAMQVLKWDGGSVGWLGAAVPLGAFIGPLVFAPIADRYFSAQKILAALHLVCGILLIVAGKQTDVFALTFLMFLVGVFFMPTVALLNSIVFKHIPDSNNAPYVFVFGTTGWIVVVLFIQAFFGGADTPQFFFVGAACCFLLSLYALTLPDTPPQAKDASAKNDGGSLMALLKQPTFLIFLVAITLAGIPACGFMFTMCGGMLAQRGFPAPLALTTINQFSELFFMAALPFCAARFGLKKVILIGMAAWFFRYFFWIDSSFTFAILGLLLHGMCYSFLYGASYMYGEKIAPPEMKATVQGVITFLLLGVGQVLGAFLAGYVMNQSPAPLAVLPAEKTIMVCREKTPSVDAANLPVSEKTEFTAEEKPAGIPEIFGTEITLGADISPKMDVSPDAKISLETGISPEAKISLGPEISLGAGGSPDGLSDRLIENAANIPSEPVWQVDAAGASGQPAGETPEARTPIDADLPTDLPAEETPETPAPRIVIQGEEENLEIVDDTPVNSVVTEEIQESVPVAEGVGSVEEAVLEDVSEISLPETEAAAEPAEEITVSQSTSITALSSEIPSEKAEEKPAEAEIPAGCELMTWKQVLKDDVLPPWNDKDQDNSAWKYLDLKKTLLGEEEKKPKSEGSIPDGTHLGIDLDLNNDKIITYEEIMNFPVEGRVYNGFLQTRETLLGIFRTIHAVSNNLEVEKVENADIKVTRQQYLSAQSHDWSKVFTIPMIMLGIAIIMFMFLGKDPKSA